MTVSPQDYERILHDNLKEELDWLIDEFELLFKCKKKKYSREDISIGNRILDRVIEDIKINNNEEALNLLAITINRLETTYPEFF